MTPSAAEPLELTGPALPPGRTKPAGGSSRAQRVAPPLLLAGGLLAVSVALHLRDPHQSGSWGYCPWLLLTGTTCPGCGGLRAVNDLTRGDLAAAFSSNALFVASLPFLAALWTRSLLGRWRGVPTPSRPTTVAWAGGVVLALVVVFWVVRNLPFARFLAP